MVSKISNTSIAKRLGIQAQNDDDWVCTSLYWLRKKLDVIAKLHSSDLTKDWCFRQHSLHVAVQSTCGLWACPVCCDPETMIWVGMLHCVQQIHPINYELLHKTHKAQSGLKTNQSTHVILYLSQRLQRCQQYESFHRFHECCLCAELWWITCIVNYNLVGTINCKHYKWYAVRKIKSMNMCWWRLMNKTMPQTWSGHGFRLGQRRCYYTCSNTSLSLDSIWRTIAFVDLTMLKKQITM